MSLFEQYEQEASMSSAFKGHSSLSQPKVDPEDEALGPYKSTPVFKKHKIDFSPPDVITHLAVANSQLIIALRNKRLLRIDTMHHNEPIEIEFSKHFGDRSNFARVHQLFLDPTGKHCLLSFSFSDSPANSESLYLAKKVQQTPKMKGHLINCIGWNHANKSENGTSNILVGTSKGLVFETELMAADNSKWLQTAGSEQYWKQVFDVGLDAGPVTAIEFHRMSSSASENCFILVTTKNRLYQFVGSLPANLEPPYLQYVFSTYSGQFQDMPGNLGFSRLDFYYPRSHSCPETFAWLTEPGVLYGKIEVSSLSSNSVTSDAVLIPYSSDADKDAFSQSLSNSKEKPLAMVLTQFHVLVLFKNHMKAICVLNEQPVLEDIFTEAFGSMIAITKDPVKGTIWAYSELAVYRYKVVDEDRDIWQIFLRKQDFEKAKYFARSDPIKLDRVICSEALHYFNQKKYSKSASLYASSNKSFEETALKFLQLGNEEALKDFLVYKLDTLSGSDVTQVTLLILWLIEILLDQMGNLRNAGKVKGEDYELLVAEFRSLLTENKIKDCLSQNQKIVHELISSHGDEENVVYFGMLMKAYGVVIEYYLQRKMFKDALEILKQERDVQLIYKYAPLLISEIPSELISLLLELKSSLDPTKLVPALLQCESKGQHVQQYTEVVRYLEHCVYSLQTEEGVIHNYLLALYAELQPEKLLTYLSLKGEDESLVSYDLKYALRICRKYGLQKACVHLYTTMGLFEEAVDLALTVDINLAKRVADMSELSEDLRKRLWLKIAKHVVLEEKDIDQVTEFLKECSLLKIEDILPFFPDFVTIDHFKDAICCSLQEYNKHIESLKEEMKEATENAQEIRQEVKELRNKYTLVRTENKCILCDYPIITRSFYVFPCQHMFHSDCLLSEMMVHLKASQRSRLEELQKALATTSVSNKSLGAAAGGESGAQLLDKDKLVNELDDIVASQCLYCGDIMIKSIDQPFILPGESSLALMGWE